MKDVRKALLGILLGAAFLLSSCAGYSPPVAVIDASPTSGDAPLTVTFDISGSYDPDGVIVSYELDFGDGTAPATGTDITQPITHTYGDDGTYTATLTVTDNHGFTGQDSVEITVTTPPGYYSCAVPVPSSCDVSHQGDLVISGSEIFTIKDQIYCQTGNVFIMDQAQLNLDGATLVIKQTTPQPAGSQYMIWTRDNASMHIHSSSIASNMFLETAFDGSSSATFSNSRIDWFHAHNTATITIQDSTICDFHLHDSCQATISDSVVGISFPPNMCADGAAVIARNENPGYYEYWDLQTAYPTLGIKQNITLYRTWVRHWECPSQ